MKTRIIITVSILLLAFQALKADEVELKADINAVTVFRSGAQVSRSGWVSIPKGNSQVILRGVSPQINAASIQASGEGDFTILSAQFLLKYEQPGQPPEVKVPAATLKAIRLLEDSLETLDFELWDLREQQNVLMQEKNILQNDKYMKTGSDTITQLAMILDLYHSRMNNINKEWLGLQKKVKADEKKKAGMNRRLQEYIAYRNQFQQPAPQGPVPVYQIVLNVSADNLVKGKVRLTYLVNSAGWNPSYELKGGVGPDKVELVYKGSVFQNTGVDWKNVRITLSNMNPNRSQYKPVLSPWYLDYYNPIVYRNEISVTSNLAMPVMEKSVIGYTDDETLSRGDTFTPALDGSYFTQVSTNFSNIEFAISLPYDIPSDGQAQVISVGKHDLPATFTYYAVPKMDKESFLVAKLTGWEAFNLLPGPANVYLGGTLVGTTSLNPYMTNDTITVSMGRDASIAIERKKVKDDSDHPLLSKQVYRTISIEISIRNSKTVPVDLILEDQVPISKNEKIEVEHVDLADADLNKETGLLTWKLALKPGETRKVTFTYKVISEKDKILIIN